MNTQTPPPPVQVLTDTQILANILQWLFASAPSVSCILRTIALMHNNVIPFDYLFAFDNASLYIALLFNAVSLGMNLPEYNEYVLYMNQQFDALRHKLSAPPATTPEFRHPYPALVLGDDSLFLPTTIPLNIDYSAFDDNDFSSLLALDDYVPDLTTQGIEPNPGPAASAEYIPDVMAQALAPAPAPAAPAPVAPVFAGFFQFIRAVTAHMSPLQLFYFFTILPFSMGYSYTAAFLNAFVMPPHRRFPAHMSHNALQIVFHCLMGLSSYIMTRFLIQILLNMAGVERNPGPSTFSKPESVLPRVSSETHSVDFSANYQESNTHSRSKEKRNSKFSRKVLHDRLETIRRQKALTHARSSLRARKEHWEEYVSEMPYAPTVPHNRRRIDAYLEAKRATPIPNGLFQKITVGCCADKKDSIFAFLTSRCGLDEFIAMALVPIIRALQKMLTSKISIAIALSVLAYFLAKYIQLPLPIVVPIATLILTFLIPDIHKTVIQAVIDLYEYISRNMDKAARAVVHSTDVKIDQSTYRYIDKCTANLILQVDFETSDWKPSAIATLMRHAPDKNEPDWSLNVPSHVNSFLAELNETKLDPRFLNDLLLRTRANALSEFCIDISDKISKLFSSLNLVSAAFALPSALFFYSSTKKFVKQVYEVFLDLYPTIYEFTTGRTYIAPEVAKYLNIFEDICKKVHKTLAESRQTNIAKESADFRLRVVVEYEALLEAQMKLLSLKAPPTYMVPVNNLLREMTSLANECYSRTKGEAVRDEPVLVFIRGPPGVGKTTLDHALSLIIANRLDIKINLNTDFFQREAGAEHFDGYMNQLFVILDDAFQLTDPVKQAATILEVIKMKNTAPYKLVMAQLEAKQNSFFNSKFIFITTNVENVVCDQVADIGAFYRRIDFDVVVKSLPPCNEDGSPSFNYDMIVNGVKCDVPTLADSITDLHRKRSNNDKKVSEALYQYASAIAPTRRANLIPARNSMKDFQGVDHSKFKSQVFNTPNVVTDTRASAAAPDPDRLNPNGLSEIFSYASKKVSHFTSISNWFLPSTIGKRAAQFSNEVNRAYNQSHYIGILKSISESQFHISEHTFALEGYTKWLAIFAVSSAALWMIVKMVKSLATTLTPNSRKVKDKLTGDKPNTVAPQTSQIKEHLKAVQAKLDKKAVKLTLKPNSSCERWSQSMISYIQKQGWQSQQWVADSLASIDDISDYSLTSQELADVHSLRTNIVDIFTYYKLANGDIFKMFGKALLLNQNTLIAPSHQIPSNCEIVNLEVMMASKTINIRNSRIDRIENSDTCVLTLSTPLPCRDISYMIVPQSEITACDSQVFLLRNFEDVLTICPVDNFEPVDRVLSYATDTNEVINCGSTFQSHVAVCTGDSGCFYVTRDKGRFKIVGMHIASNYYHASGRFIFREMLKNYMRAPRKAATAFDSVKKAVEANSRSFDERLACNSNCVPIGIVAPRTLISSRSKIQRSFLYHDSRLPSPTEVPVVLKRTYDSNDGLLKSNEKFRLRDDPIIDQALQDEIVHALLDEHPNLPTKTFYSNIEAIEGTKDMPKIAMSTSSGYPYSASGKTPKTKLDESDWVEICSQTDSMLEDLYNGHMPQAIFQTSFKDELRPPEKSKTPRVINCAPTSLTLLFRRVLGPWMNMVHANHSKIRTKVGINAHGSDWKVLFEQLIAISAENIIELDYKGYEYNHFQTAFRIIADLMYSLYIRSGFSQRDAQAARLLILSCASGFVIQNDVLIFIWMLLSGLPITAELNSLLNEVYQMIAYKHLTGLPLIEMRKLVASAFYGDDLIHAVHDSIKDQFNAVTVQKFLLEQLSMTVTPASNKSGEISPFIHVLECSFLCRRFCPRENRVDAPLRLSSSTDSLQFYNPVAHMTQKELISSKCRSFITELTHQPPEIFAHWSSVLASIKSQYSLEFINYDYAAALNRRITLGDEQD